MFKKKRGFILDWIWFAFTVLLIIICFIIGSYFVHEFNTKAQASDMASEAKSISADNASNFSVVYDWIYVGLFFGLGMIIIFSFYLLNSHPALFIPLAILILFIIVIVAVSGNIYDRFSEVPQLASTVSDFQYSDYLMDHIVELVLGMSMIGLIVMFIKLGEG
jgi:divalent metal cation (Fe/Co/Zn/Cd) transporter